MRAPLPPNEDARLEALRRLEILDTAAEPQFDDLAHDIGIPGRNLPSGSSATPSFWPEMPTYSSTMS